MKTTLASIRQSIPSSAAQRMLRRPHSGGLEDICKAQFNRIDWPLKSASMTVVILEAYSVLDELGQTSVVRPLCVS